MSPGRAFKKKQKRARRKRLEDIRDEIYTDLLQNTGITYDLALAYMVGPDGILVDGSDGGYMRMHDHTYIPVSEKYYWYVKRLAEQINDDPSFAFIFTFKSLLGLADIGVDREMEDAVMRFYAKPTPPQVKILEELIELTKNPVLVVYYYLENDKSIGEKRWELRNRSDLVRMLREIESLS